MSTDGPSFEEAGTYARLAGFAGRYSEYVDAGGLGGQHEGAGGSEALGSRRWDHTAGRCGDRRRWR